MQKSNTIYGAAAALLLCAAALAQAKSFESKRDESLEAEDNSVSAVIPSPNADGLGDYAPLYAADIQRNSAAAAAASAHEANLKRHQQEATSASDESGVPVYVSPFARADSHTASHARHPLRFEHSDASSHAPPNYAPRPAASAPSGDLKTSASYGHHHGHHGYGYGPSGWLDMGAWTGHKGSFGWYADYPVGSKHGHYGRR